MHEDEDYMHWLNIYHLESSPGANCSQLPADPPNQDTGGDSFMANFQHESPLVGMSPHPCESTGSSTYKSPPTAGSILKSPQQGPEESTVLSKLMVPPSVTPRRQKVTPKARLLTSAEAIRILEEKQEKNQQETEEKERRKKKREAKRLEKVEEQKRKAEERAKKSEERARRAEEKAQAKAGRAKEKVQRSAACNTRTDLQSISPPKKRLRMSERQHSLAIDTNICCVCMTAYEEDVQEQIGLDWVACACGRWLHEECAEDCIQDQSGNDRLCPFCIDILLS